MKVLFGILAYIIIAAVVTFALFVASVKTGVYDPHRKKDYPYRQDFPWPILCGIFWPLAGPIAAAFIAANWFLKF